MENKNLKKTLLGIVDNQLKSNDPVCTGWAFEQLKNAGYSAREAKEKLSSVVLTEIYDVMRNNQPFDEQRFEKAMMELVEQCTGSGDGRDVPEWEEIARLMQEGYEALHSKARQYSVMTDRWLKAWEILKKLINGAEMPLGISDLDEATDYEYGLEGWLQDMVMELGNAGEHEKRLRFCREVIELFSWQYEDNGGYKLAVAESLYALDHKAEVDVYLNEWLAQEPRNADAINAKSVCLEADGKDEEAYDWLEQEIGDQSCTLDNDILFARICWLGEKLGRTDKLNYYREKYEKFQESLGEMGINPYWDALPYMSVEPVVKPDKIYPNDPCPCGSGKKYKKCCGRNR